MSELAEAKPQVFEEGVYPTETGLEIPSGRTLRLTIRECYQRANGETFITTKKNALTLEIGEKDQKPMTLDTMVDLFSAHLKILRSVEKEIRRKSGKRRSPKVVFFVTDLRFIPERPVSAGARGEK